MRRLPLAGRDPDAVQGGSLDAYLETLDRLEPLVEQAAHVVPGHGAPLDAVRAAAILREDREYLRALARRAAAARPADGRAEDDPRGERGGAGLNRREVVPSLCRVRGAGGRTAAGEGGCSDACAAPCFCALESPGRDGVQLGGS